MDIAAKLSKGSRLNKITHNLIYEERDFLSLTGILAVTKHFRNMSVPVSLSVSVIALLVPRGVVVE